jgi:hypothetical protein
MITIRTQNENGLMETGEVLKNCWIDVRNVSKEDQHRHHCPGAGLPVEV